MLFSFERQWKDDHPYHKVSGGEPIDYFNDMDMPKLLKSIEKVDDYTVKITLNRAERADPRQPRHGFRRIQSKEYADVAAEGRHAGDSSTRSRSAPGRSSSSHYQKDAVIRYKAFPRLLGRQGRRSTTSSSRSRRTPTARWAKLQKGECQVMAYPNPADLEAMDKPTPTSSCCSSRASTSAIWAFNTTKPPFDKQEVRQALNMAIDKEAIIEDGLSGRRPARPRT